jgi:hypothetical protein
LPEILADPLRATLQWIGNAAHGLSDKLWQIELRQIEERFELLDLM